MLVANIPAIRDLEEETKQAVIAQYDRHMRYEAAARRMVGHEVAKLSRALKSESSALSQEWESECSRIEAHYEERERKAAVEAERSLEEERKLAQQEREGLERAHEAQEERLAQVYEEREAQLVRAHQIRESEWGAAMGASLVAREAAERAAYEAEERAEVAEVAAEQAQADSDLKRECSKKLKEEVIENDKLTLATLNRIKTLEAALEQSRCEADRLEDQVSALERQNGALADQAGEADRMRQLLRERETTILVLSDRLQDLSEQLDASDSAKAERRLEHSVDRAMQERGQLGHLAAAHKIVSGFAEALKEPRRDSFLNRISASSFGL